MSRRPSHEHDDRGASLILALVFVFVIGMVLVAVGGLAANALLNTSNARTQRTSTGDAEAAVTVAMQYLRYNPAPDPIVPPPSCLPTGSSIPSSDPKVTGDIPMQVDCTWVVNQTSPQTRIVDFFACPLSVTTLSACKSSATLHAQVTYNDLIADGSDDCRPAQPPLQPSDMTTSCGMKMNVDIWDVIGADN
jgi:hypothetical protein